MSSEFHSLLIHGDHTRCIEVYNNKNTEDLENDAEKSFAKTSVLLHQNCDSYPEAFHHVNLNSELNPLHVHKESIERPVHGIQNDLFSQILGQDTQIEETLETSECLPHEVREDYSGSGLIPANDKDSSEMAHQDHSKWMPSMKFEAQSHESELDSGEPRGERVIAVSKEKKQDNEGYSVVVTNKEVESVFANVQTHEEGNFLDPDDESRIRAELEMEIERDLEREIKAKIMMLNQRLEDLQSKRHSKEEQGKDTKPLLMGGTLKSPQIEHLKEVIKEETLPKASFIEGESAPQLLLQGEESVTHRRSAPSSIIDEPLPKIPFIKTGEIHANDQNGLLSYSEIPKMHSNVREFPSAIIDALLDKDVHFSCTETHTIHWKKLVTGGDQAYHNLKAPLHNAAKSKHNSVGGAPTSAKANHNSIGVSLTSVKSRHNTFGESPPRVKAKDNSFGESPTSVKSKDNSFGESPMSVKSSHNSFEGSPTSVKDKQNVCGGSPTNGKAKQNKCGGSPTSVRARENIRGGSLASVTAKQNIFEGSPTSVQRIETSYQHTNAKTKTKFDWTQSLRADSCLDRPGTHTNTARGNWDDAVARTLFRDDVSVKNSLVHRATKALLSNNNCTDSLERTKKASLVSSEECSTPSSRRRCYLKPPLPAKPCQETHNTSELNAAKGRHASKASSPQQLPLQKVVNKPKVWK